MKISCWTIQVVFLLAVSPLLAQTFSNATHLVHPAIGNSGLGISAADFNGDGLPDIYYPWAFYINRGAAGFEEVKYLTGVEEGINVFGAAFGDYDNDGFLDVFFEDLGAPGRLYRNKGTLMLEYANPVTGLAVNPAAQGAGWSDYNLDGTLDLFVSNDFGDNQLFRNNNYRFLTDVSAAAGAAASGNSYGMAWGDYNLDGYPDVFITTCNVNPANSIKHLLRNNGDGTFTDVNYTTGVADSADSWGVIWLDFNNDANLDIYIANIYHSMPSRPAHNKLYRNNGDGTFTDAGIAAGVAGSFDEFSWGAAAADFDNDG